MKRISIVAVLVGGAIDYGVSSLVAVPLTIYVMVTRSFTGMTQAQIQKAAVAAIHASTPLYTAQLVGGTLATVLGGWLAGRIAGHDETLNGLLTAWLGLAFGIYSLAKGQSSTALWLQLVLMLIVTPAAGWAGGWLAAQRRRRPSTR